VLSRESAANLRVNARMSDIFREVDEDLSRENAAKLWDKYSIFVYGLALLIVLATAGYRGYEYWHTKQAEAAGAQYDAAVQLLKDGKADEGRAALERLQTAGSAGYAVLSRFQLAAQAGKADATAGAKAYDALADDVSLAAQFRDVARLQWALLSVDVISLQELQTKLAPLVQGTGAFRNSARELLGLGALKANDLDNAGRYFDAIVTDATAPQGLRARAQAFLALVQSARPAQKSGG